jgi:hypothetical protein
VMTLARKRRYTRRGVTLRLGSKPRVLESSRGVGGHCIAQRIASLPPGRGLQCIILRPPRREATGAGRAQQTALPLGGGGRPRGPAALPRGPQNSPRPLAL